MIIRGLDDRFPKRNIDSIIYQGSWFESNANEIVIGWSSAYDLGISTQDGLNPINLYVPKPGKGQVFSEKDILKSEKVLASGIFSINEELNNSIVFLVQRDSVNASTIASPIFDVLKGVMPSSPNKSWVLAPFDNTFSIDCSKRSASAPSSKL